MSIEPKYFRDPVITLGGQFDPVADDPTENWSMISLLKGVLDTLQDGLSVAVTPEKADTGTVTSINSSTSSQTLITANANRIGLVVVNTDANSAYLKFGQTAATTIGDFTVIVPSGVTWFMDPPIYTGRIDVIWPSDGSGGVSVTELTAS